MILEITSQIYNLYQFISFLTTKCDTINITTRDAFFGDILTWNHYLIAPLYCILVMPFCELIYDITMANICFWKLCWHPKRQSIWQILSDPKGHPGRYETKINPDKTKFHHQNQSNLTNKLHSQQRKNKGLHI